MENTFTTPWIKDYSPEATQHILINLASYESQIRTIKKATGIARWEAIEQVIPQLQGRDWCEANGFARIF